MQLTVLDPIGVRVDGLLLSAVGPDQVQQLRSLLAEHGVLVLREQETDDAVFVAFLREFGELAFTAGETPVEGFADLNVVSNVGRKTPPRSTFHVDTSYVRHPPAYTALRAVQIPEQGGQTLFTNQYRALATLPAGLRARVEGRTITHVVTGLDVPPESAEHPVFRGHPVTGQPALYLTAPARCAAVSGLSAPEAAECVAALFEHSTRPENTYRHSWAPGDVVMWDNAVVLHRADHDGVVGDRVMHRGMVASYS